MSVAPELEELHHGEAVKLGIPVRPAVLHTGWDVGPVAAFLFPTDPVTLIDAGLDNDLGRSELEAAFASTGRRPQELRRVIVTHGHSDHLGGARWLQEVSRCEVLLHRDDVPGGGEGRAERRRQMMKALGFSPEVTQRVFGRTTGGRQPERRYPVITELQGGEVLETGGRRLAIQHRPGHSPGHVWVVDEGSRAILAGDYLLAGSPTNAGLEPDPDDPTRRRPMLGLYHAGLEVMAGIDTPVVFAGHGPPITGHRALIGRRLGKSHRRTEHVLNVLRRAGRGTAFEVTYSMYGERLARNPFDMLADVVGRLDLLAADGRATASLGSDGAWRFEAVSTPDTKIALDR